MKSQDYYKNSTWKDIPDIVMIELTNACNLSCAMCSNKQMTRKKGFMSDAIFKKALDACVEAKMTSIKLYTTGESLLHPRFIELWRIAANYPFNTIQISTNGALLTDDILDEILESDKARIQFSFSGWDKLSYESRYFGANFEKTILKIKHIMAAIKTAKRQKSVLTINGATSRASGAVGKTKKFLIDELKLDSSQLKIHNANNWVDVVCDKEIEEIKSNSENIRNPNDKISKEASTYYCHIANTRIGILYDGRVTACGCLDVNGELVIGNIVDESIKDIRAGKLFRDFVSKLSSGDISSLMCRKCDSRKRIV